ncbi:MAG TPA: glucose-1-phosphate adenylyltransferase [Anaerolineales bacterium]|nr:glucose-1-phosphate adenylyltransferase [Anaerolineales bacterium]HNA90018.1 glucose-1-phosphate adenylyltransferase [Anaerolineales bacterium]HNB35389.1 glucose-1-phosphate adenylyltransferase [Anaerolineales bacterium]HNC08026.1 glucose-1-phosphate adenylyltransferase [Anaerolineales bacterium]
MPSFNDILAVILGGGRGARLYPLTQMRSKPAVPIAGKYRLIDIPISNCINSEIFRIAILTQFNSVSLHRHITRTYDFDSFHQGWVQIWAAEQTMESADWYQGTADAVRKQMLEIQATGSKYVLILAGDHLYRMNYKAMAEYHWANKADITVAVQPVAKEEASRFGILKRESDGRISNFVEKPKDPEIQKQFISRDDPKRPFLGSMGIYMFNTKVLLDMISNFPDHDDFGGDIIPEALGSHSVYGFDFDDYWQDIGTIRSFYETNLMLTRPDSPFNFYDAKLPIYTDMRYLPASIVEDSSFKDVLIAEGSRVLKSEITHSIIGIRSQIAAGCVIKDSIIMGADYFERDWGGLPIGIGANSHIEGAILDKNARIGENVTIRPFPRGTDMDHEKWYVRDGIVIIPKDIEIPSDTVIAP